MHCCFSTVAMVKRTRHNVTFYVYCLLCLGLTAMVNRLMCVQSCTSNPCRNVHQFLGASLRICGTVPCWSQCQFNDKIIYFSFKERRCTYYFCNNSVLPPAGKKPTEQTVIPGTVLYFHKHGKCQLN
jgi:hypothetical protein